MSEEKTGDGIVRILKNRIRESLETLSRFLRHKYTKIAFFGFVSAINLFILWSSFLDGFLAYLRTREYTGDQAWVLVDLAGFSFSLGFAVIAAVVAVVAVLELIEKKSIKVEDRKTFGTFAGIVRSLMAWTLVIIFGYTILNNPANWNTDIPMSLVICLNIALIYYGIKPESILPASLVHKDEIKEPTTESLIRNFPSLYKTLKDMEEGVDKSFEGLENAIGTIDDDIKGQLEKMKEIAAKARAFVDVKKEIADDTLVNWEKEVKKKQIDLLGSFGLASDGIEKIKPSIHFQNPLDALAFILLAFLGSLIVITFPNAGDDLALEVVVGSSFAIIAVTAGNLLRNAISTTPYNRRVKKIYALANEEIAHMMKQVNIASMATIEGIRKIKKLVEGAEEIATDSLKEFNEIIAKVESATSGIADDIKERMSRYRTSVEQVFDRFWDENVLDSLPQDLSAIIAIAIMTALFYLSIIPQWVDNLTAETPTAPILSYAVILWLFSYYFATRKQKTTTSNTISSQ
ncbi:MAG: hypothetical protein ACFFD4_32695 [Candidatus Odinarchaeota archaeon]